MSLWDHSLHPQPAKYKEKEGQGTFPNIYPEKIMETLTRTNTSTRTPRQKRSESLLKPSKHKNTIVIIIVFLRESRQLGLLGLGSGYGCLQLLSYIRVLRLQLLYYRRALQLASLGYGGLGLGLGGAWRSDSQPGDHFIPQYDEMPGQSQEYSDQYQYHSWDQLGSPGRLNYCGESQHFLYNLYKYRFRFWKRKVSWLWCFWNKYKSVNISRVREVRWSRLCV